MTRPYSKPLLEWMVDSRNWASSPPRSPRPHHLFQLLQPLQQGQRRGLVRPNGLQNVRPTPVHAVLLQVGPIAHKVDDTVHRPVPPLLEQIGQMGTQGGALPSGPGRGAGLTADIGQDGLSLPVRPSAASWARARLIPAPSL